MLEVGQRRFDDVAQHIFIDQSPGQSVETTARQVPRSHRVPHASSLARVVHAFSTRSPSAVGL